MGVNPLGGILMEDGRVVWSDSQIESLSAMYLAWSDVAQATAVIDALAARVKQDNPGVSFRDLI